MVVIITVLVVVVVVVCIVLILVGHWEKVFFCFCFSDICMRGWCVYKDVLVVNNEVEVSVVRTPA